MSQSVAGRQQVEGRYQVLVGLWLTRDLQLKCAMVLHKTLLILVLMYGSKTMIWKEEERSRIRMVQMNK